MKKIKLFKLRIKKGVSETEKITIFKFYFTKKPM